jgi:hypothetical protein
MNRTQADRLYRQIDEKKYSALKFTALAFFINSNGFRLRRNEPSKTSHQRL